MKFENETKQPNFRKEINVVIEHKDWDQEYLFDKSLGRAIDIYETNYKDKKNNEKNLHGALSPEFCTDWTDRDAFSERYRCKCGQLTGKALEGEVCENCLTKVDYKDVDYTKTGWISLNGFKIIQPNYYVLLKSLIGATNLQDIITRVVTIDIDGNEIENIPEKTTIKKRDKKKVRVTIEDEDDEVVVKKSKSSSNPYYGKGIIWLSSHIREVIFYYWRKNRKIENKCELAQMLLLDVDKIFTSHIPVYSAALRPEKVDAETFSFYSPNTLYQTIVTSSWIVNNEQEIPDNRDRTKADNIEKALEKIQSTVMKLYDVIIDSLNDKNGQINDKITGGNYCWTSRNVIAIDPTLKAWEIDLPYVCFGELFKFEIIGHLARIKDISETEAYNIYSYGMTHFDEEIYQIMEYIIEKYEPAFIVNRNPTIKYGSIICMRIRKVHRKYNNFTMTLGTTVLTALNADFDGDTLNIKSIKTTKMRDEYEATYSYKYNFCMSVLDGLFNPECDLLKDSSIAIYQFANC